MPTSEPSFVFNAVCDMIVDAVHDCGELGTPLVVLYLPFMSRKILDLDGFNAVINFLVFAKKVRKSGDCLYPMQAE
jgi:hypothetical protein